jgi:AcrR family transcriptional regulator
LAAAEHTLESREAILAAALAAFTENGFEGTTLREVAARAHINHGLIRYHFGNKLQLWKAAVDRAFSELRSVLEAIDADGDPQADAGERGRQLVRGYVHFVARHPHFVCLMNEEGKRHGERMRWLVDRHVKPLYARVSSLLYAAQEEGLVSRAITPAHFHYILAGSAGLIYQQAPECKRLTGTDPFADEAIEQHARIVELLFFGPRAD